ncbi:TonB-dependent receptor [Allosphingosinicella flava]|uniref:TonB-dependent receptor n=1 Tax=Allosphingosinicella flava TaxID=2771430 RepID=A0A7T2GJX2_9SPHN|nr:TonB-dependent receptor [Sphingosinicella flava]QPQ55234.1 TonB-dependent receptor [Sphingosinicella flava]
MKMQMTRSLLASTVIAGCAFAAAPLAAQEAPSATEEQAAQDEPDAIVVTGSRIARPDLDSIVPVTVIGSQDIQADAATNIQDTLTELPQFGVGNTRTNTNFLTSGNGVATLNLRNLGGNRTLTLVNGRRFIAGLAGTSAVDVNNIPAEFIERVETVTGGASSVYGSDAIAGVVNFILRDKIEGISIRSQYNITDEGDNPRYYVGATGGTTFMGDRGSVIAHLSYDKDTGLLSRKRDISDQDCGTPLGNAAGIICGPASYSIYGPQGQFYYVNTAGAVGSTPNFSFDPNNNLITGRGAGFNRNAERYIAVPVERLLGSAIVRYDLTDNLELFAEGTYAKTKSRSRLEPSAIAIGPIATQDIPQVIAIDNPFIPAAIQAVIAARNSDANPANDITGIAAQRRFNEVFDRSNKNDRDVYRIATGLRGDFAGGWNYDLSYVFGQFKDYTESETAVKSRIANALDAIRLPSGEIVCRSVAARAEGCAPLNLFGAGTASEAASAYVQSDTPRSLDITNTQHVVSASISGSPVTLWAGDLGIALGVEYRKEKTFADNDVLTNAGLNIGNVTQDLKGQFDVIEGFGEVNLPLLKDQFVNYLGLTGAIRVSDYSTIGTVVSWNAGAEFEPFTGLRFRGVYANANRAPNISELFTPPNETFASITDPCNGVTASNNPGGYGAACRAIPAIAADIAANGTFSYTLSQQQSVNGFVGGNTDLNEETAKTLTLGAVVAPLQVPGLSLTVDYFKIKVEDAIATLGRQTSVQQCLLTGNPVFCDNVIRGTDGRLRTVNGQLINVSTFKTSGIDANLRYDRRIGESDRISFTFNYSHLLYLKTQGNPSAPVIENAGTAGVSKDRFTTRLSYTTGPFTASWQSTFLSKAVSSSTFTNSNPDIVAMNKIPSYLYHDVQLRYNIGDGNEFSLYGGVNNVFDKKPPFLPNPPFTASITGTETQADVYDPFGRRFYIGVRVGF